MKTIQRFVSLHWRPILFSLLSVLILALLFGFRLSSLTHGISASEQRVATTPIGWHGIKNQPLFLPLEFLRSVIFKLHAHHGALSVRLPSVFFGVLAVISVAVILRMWHSVRITIFGTLLFATASWTLHASRLGSTDAVYLSVLPVLVMSIVLLQRYYRNPFVYYGSLLAWGVLLYVPGVVWLLLLTVWFSRHELAKGWTHFGRWWQRTLYVLAGLIWLPLLIDSFRRTPSSIRTWLGAPTHLPTSLHFVKQFAAVFFHLFVKGPEYPQLWLGRLPILDIFTLVMCIIGIYFYVRHLQANRTHLLASLFVISALLIALGGPVGLSLAVPLLYLLAAAGIAYLLHVWFEVFPRNPLAHNFGLTIVVIAIAISCIYNLRSYFIAWPNNDTTRTVFYLKD